MAVTFRRSLYIALGISLYGAMYGMLSKNMYLFVISVINIVIFMLIRSSW